jgi:hypothetical protein
MAHLYRCGHEAFLRAGRDTAAVIESLAERDCRTCGHENARKDAAAVAEQLGLPVLVNGSDKQVAWALSIRDGVRRSIEEIPALRGGTPATDALLYGVSDARWWIDHRDDPLMELIGWVDRIVSVALAAQSVAVAA